MTATAIVFASIMFAAALILLPLRIIASPSCSFLGLLILSFTHTKEGFPLLPINNNLIFGWLCITVVVTLATLLQPRPVRDTSKGMGYIMVGAIAGMAIGLLGFNVTPHVGGLYAIMIVATALGTFLGFLIFTNTPDGKRTGIASGNFFTYLLAKGFPTAITLMQAGVVLVLIIAMHNYQILS